MSEVRRLPMALRRRPPAQALRWAERAVGTGARVQSVRRLHGGTSSAVHALRVVTRAGEVRALVLRRFVRPEVVEEEPDIAEREARVLETLADVDVPAPRLLAVDPTGGGCDVPAVLMTRLPGRTDLAPRDLGAALDQMAALLPKLHSAGPQEGVPSYFPYYVEHEPVVPAWTRRPGLWRKAFQLVEGPWPDERMTFIHRDYHPGNVLWRRGRLSGLTDWASASNGPPGVDVAHCAGNLADLFGLEAAQRFEAAYESDVGRKHHPYWDVIAGLDRGDPDATQWRDAGRGDLSDTLLRQRREEFLDWAVRRLC